MGSTGESGSTNARAFFGIVDNTVEALRLVRAAQQGVVPRIRRRLNNEERDTMIVSGAVFVFNVEEAVMKRWTDGKSWSPSRIDGNFLLYRELDDRKDAVIVYDRFEEWRPADDVGATASRSKARGSRSYGGFSGAETPPAIGVYKAGGLLKKTITVKVNGLEYHLIAYFIQEDIDVGKLPRISSRSDIMNVDMPPNIFHFSEFRLSPKVIEGADGQPSRIVCEPYTMVHIDNAAAEESAEPPQQRVSIHPPESLMPDQTEGESLSLASSSENAPATPSHAVQAPRQMASDIPVETALSKPPRDPAPEHRWPSTGSAARQEYGHSDPAVGTYGDNSWLSSSTSNVHPLQYHAQDFSMDLRMSPECIEEERRERWEFRDERIWFSGHAATISDPAAADFSSSFPFTFYQHTHLEDEYQDAA